MILPLLTVAGGLAGGSLVTGLILDRRQRRRLLALDRVMTRQIRRRYEAYLELEETVERLAEELSQNEAEARAALDYQHAQIRLLTREIEEHAAQLAETTFAGTRPRHEEQADPGAERGFGWVFEQEDAEAQGGRERGDEAPVGAPERGSEEVYRLVEVSHAEPRAEGTLDMDLEDFERRLQSVQNEKRAQLERQRSLIAELTECVVRLKPMPAVLRERERELVGTHRRMDELEARHKQRVSELETRLQELDRRLEGESVRRRTEVEVLQESYRELEQRKEAEIRALHDRLHELEEVRRESEGLRARLAEAEAELEALRAERDQHLEEVQGLSSRLESTEESLSGQRSRITELMRALETAEQDLESQKATLDDQESTLEEARAVVAELRPTIESLEDGLSSFEEACSEDGREAE